MLFQGSERKQIKIEIMLFRLFLFFVFRVITLQYAFFSQIL